LKDEKEEEGKTTETSFEKALEDIENFYVEVEDFEKASKLV